MKKEKMEKLENVKESLEDLEAMPIDFKANRLNHLKKEYLKKEEEKKKKLSYKIKNFILEHILILFMLFIGILTYMVGLRDKAEAEAFENEQNKIKIEEVKEK